MVSGLWIWDAQSALETVTARGCVGDRGRELVYVLSAGIMTLIRFRTANILTRKVLKTHRNKRPMTSLPILTLKKVSPPLVGV